MQAVKNLKIAFMGNSAFAVPILEMLSKNFNVTAVVTSPDRPVGRGKKLKSNEIKVVAENLGLRVIQLDDMEEVYRNLKSLSLDLIVVASFGRMLQEKLLKLPRYGCLNVHASLLPRYRGASPIQAAILNGDRETGVTIMLVSKKLDAGDIISQESVKIDDNDDYETLSKRLSEIGANLLVRTIPLYISGELKPRPQDKSKASYCGIIDKLSGRIDWNMPARYIVNMVRAFTPWPSAYFTFRGKIVKVLKVKVDNLSGKPGMILSTRRKLVVATGERSVRIDRLKVAGKREITGTDFALGYRLKVGDLL